MSDTSRTSRTKSRTSRTKGRPCSVCDHTERRNLEIALLAGASVREVAQRYHLTKSTVARHQRLHLRPRLTPAEVAAPAIVQAIDDQNLRFDVMASMRELHTRTLALLTKAEASNDMHVALRAVREARGNLELLGRLDGSLDGPTAPTSGNVIVQVQYIDKAIVQHPPAPPALPPGD
jgi:hypothetical protein